MAFYAETTVGNLFWRGDVEVPFGNRTLQMMNGTLPVHADGSYKLGLSCPDYAPPDSTPAEPLVIGALLQERDSVTVGARTYRRAVVVVGVMRGYPAMQAGMQAGDVIRNINGQVVTSSADVQQSVNDGSQGDRMISVYRPGGSRILVVEPTVAPIRSELDYQRCLGCTICVEACPTGCIGLKTVRGTRETIRYPQLAKVRNCIGCAFCMDACPVDAVEMDQKAG